jgi:hypothetical protein
MILKQFVEVFENASPVARSFIQAMRDTTTLIAKEQALKSFQDKMEREMSGLSGLSVEEFELKRTQSVADVRTEFDRVIIFGGSSARENCWKSIDKRVGRLADMYRERNERSLEQALCDLAPSMLLGMIFLSFDRVSDWTCDWWSCTCQRLSTLMSLFYILIFSRAAMRAVKLMRRRGKVAVAVAGAELFKETICLVGVYSEQYRTARWLDLPGLVLQLLQQIGIGRVLPKGRTPWENSAKKGS